MHVHAVIRVHAVTPKLVICVMYLTSILTAMGLRLGSSSSGFFWLFNWLLVSLVTRSDTT